MAKSIKEIEERSVEWLDVILNTLNLEVTEDSNSLFCITYKDRKKHTVSVKRKLAVALYRLFHFIR